MKLMTRSEIVKLLCQEEGKKSQVGAGNMREVLKILEKLTLENLIDDTKPNILDAIYMLAYEKLK
jgi:hypothetical protein